MPTPDVSVTVRPANPSDLPDMARMAAGLVHQHHGFDAQRFWVPPDVEQGYRWWFGKELENPGACLLVARDPSGGSAGYAYARLEELDFNALLDACCALHDIWVEPAFRRHGVARQLMEAVLAFGKKQGAPRVVLSSASANTGAHAFFARMGFRHTMVEMTRELP